MFHIIMLAFNRFLPMRDQFLNNITVKFFILMMEPQPHFTVLSESKWRSPLRSSLHLWIDENLMDSVQDGMMDNLWQWNQNAESLQLSLHWCMIECCHAEGEYVNKNEQTLQISAFSFQRISQYLSEFMVMPVDINSKYSTPWISHKTDHEFACWWHSLELFNSLYFLMNINQGYIFCS